MRYDYEDTEREWVDNKIRYIGATDCQVTYGGGNDPRGILEVGKEYEVEDCDVHDSKTDIYLKNFPGKKFNSVYFSIVESDPEKEILEQIVREMKTNSGKFAMKSVIDKPISKILKKKTRKQLVKNFTRFRCVEVDIEEAFAKIELAFGYLAERYVVIRDATFVSDIFDSKKKAKKYIDGKKSQICNQYNTYTICKEVS